MARAAAMRWAVMRRAPCEIYVGWELPVAAGQAESLATSRRSLLTLSNWQPKYMVAT